MWKVRRLVRGDIADQKNVEFILNYHPTPPQSARFTNAVSLPPGVVAKSVSSSSTSSLNLAGRSLMEGANVFQFDRSKSSDAFTLTFYTSAGQCYATAQPVESLGLKGSAPSNFNYSCSYQAGFNGRAEGFNLPTQTCHHLPPGGSFIAFFTGVINVDAVTSGSWVIAALSSSAANPTSDNHLLTARARDALLRDGSCDRARGIPPDAPAHSGESPRTDGRRWSGLRRCGSKCCC